MTSTAHIKQELTRFLNNPEAEVLCITGEWGVGKTFLWNEAVKQCKQAESIALDNYAYVSLFGCASLEALKLAIFEGSEHINPKKHGEQLEPIMKAANFIAKKMQKFRGTAAEAPMLGAWIKAGSGLFFQTVREQIICIDDIERRGSELRVLDVLGLISLLREQRACKIVLILNEHKLKKVDRKHFSTQLEKVVDVKLQFEPTAVEAAEIALQGGDIVSKQLKVYCTKLGINNIRVIKKIERFARVADGILSDHEQQTKNSAFQIIALFGWSNFQPKNAPDEEYIFKNRRVGWIRLPDGTQETEQEIKWKALLIEYNFRFVDDFALALNKGIKRGYFDVNEVLKFATENEAQLQENSVETKYHNAWRLFHDSFQDNRAAAIQAIISSTESYIQRISGNNFDATIRLLKDLDEERKATELIEKFVVERNAEQPFWQRTDAFCENVSDPDVIEAFSSKLKTLQETKVIDHKTVLLRCSKGGSWSPSDIDALSEISPKALSGILKQFVGDDLDNSINFLLLAKRTHTADVNIQKMTENALEALKLIAEESLINKIRLKWRFGI